jgi:hypothetical protein
MRVGALISAGNILSVQARVFRLMARGKLDTATGCRWIAALGDMRRTSEQAVLEGRVTALEKSETTPEPGRRPASVVPLRAAR